MSQTHSYWVRDRVRVSFRDSVRDKVRVVLGTELGLGLVAELDLKCLTLLGYEQVECLGKGLCKVHVYT